MEQLRKEQELQPTTTATPTTSFWRQFQSRRKEFWASITVEPMLAFYIIPSVFCSVATQNLNLEKACRVNLRLGQTVCDALSARETQNYTMEEREVQQLVASMNVWKTMLQSAVPALFILFVGSWSDRWGRRKPCMLIPITGEFMMVTGLIICTYFFDELPMEVAGVVEGLFPAITGGWVTMFMGVFSYIGDVTTVESRTVRIGIANVFCSLGIPIGMTLNGLLNKRIGFYGVFSLAAIMYAFAFGYAYFFIPEPKHITSTTTMNSNGQNDDRGHNGRGNGSRFSSIRDFFNVKHLMETFRVAFKQGENQRRKKVILLMLVVMVVIGPMHGEMNVVYLFTRYRFNWDGDDFSMYATFNMLANLIGTSVSVGIFSHYLKIDDAIIGIYSSLSKMLSGFIYGFAKVSYVFYLGAIAEILNGTSFIAMRSIASKLVPPDELGKVNSLFGACEALMPLVYGPMYSATYVATISYLPGAFYILGSILTIPAVVIFAWMYVQHKKPPPPETITSIHVKIDAPLKDVIWTPPPDLLKAGSEKSQQQTFNGGVNNPTFEMDT